MGFEELKRRKGEILVIAAKHGVTGIRVFGSVARGQAGENSDIDFLVEMEQNRSLMDLGGLLEDLKKLLKCRVDVVTPNGLHWYIKEEVLREARPL